MGNVIQFTQNQAYGAKYWYEDIPYTLGPAALAAGTTRQVNVTTINRTRIPRWVAEFSRPAMTQNAAAQWNYQFDANQIQVLADQGFADAMPAGVRELENLHLPAIQQLVISSVNSAGAPIAGYQFNYHVAMRRLTLADKLLRGITQYTDEEQEALADKDLDVAGFVKRGFGPIPMSAQIERTYRNRRLYAATRTFHIAATAADQTLVNIRANEAGPDAFVVLREMAVEGASAITLSADRDDDLNYVGVAGAAMVDGDDKPFTCFVPAKDFLTFHVQAGGAVPGVTIRLGLWFCKFSDLLRVRWGLAGRGDVDERTYLRAIAGVA